MAPHSDHETQPSNASNIEDIDIPVLIVGGGPTGLTQAHMLSRLGGKYHNMQPMCCADFGQ